MNLQAATATLLGDLHAAADDVRAQDLQRFFPAPVAAYGVPNQEVAKIAARFLSASPEYRDGGVWALGEALMLEDGAHHEVPMLASALVTRTGARMPEQGLLPRFRTWLDGFVSNWAQCDDLCIKAMFACLQRREHLLPAIAEWTGAASPWTRRAANVAWVKFVGRSEQVTPKRIEENCLRLIDDHDPYVQKGVGWLLKVAAARYPSEILPFLEAQAPRFKRETLRYAIEKLAPEVRRALMEVRP